MAIEVRVPSGSKIPPLFTPVEVFQIGNPGQPTQLIVHNGMLYVYNPAGQTLIHFPHSTHLSLSILAILSTKEIACCGQTFIQAPQP